MFHAAGCGVASIAATTFVLPAETLLINVCASRCRADALIRLDGAVYFTKRVAAGDERNGFLVIHGHTAKGFANVYRCRQRIGIAIWPTTASARISA